MNITGIQNMVEFEKAMNHMTDMIQGKLSAKVMLEVSTLGGFETAEVRSMRVVDGNLVLSSEES